MTSAGGSDAERFDELIQREFGHQSSEPEAAGESGSEQPGFGFRAWTLADEPEQEFTPPPPPQARPWSLEAIAGVWLLAFAMASVLLSALGLELPALVPVLAGLACVAGVVLLLRRLSRRPPSDGDGAVV